VDFPLTIPRQQIPWTVWPLWVGASAVGNGLGAIAPHWLQQTFRDVPSVPIMITGELIMLTLPAILQWLVLRHWLPRAGWWIPAGAVGKFLSFFPIGWAINRFPPSPYASPFAAVAALLLAGAVAGAMEWLVLRRWVRQAGWWVLARSIGTFGAIYVFSFVTRGGEFRIFLGGLSSGALSSAISGLALMWLLRSFRASSSRQPTDSADERKICTDF
jgi:hypothetical protein